VCPIPKVIATAVIVLLPERSACVCCPTGRLLELETAAWKDDRRFRLMTVDDGTFSFTDLMFNTPSKPATKGVAPPPAPTTPGNITISGKGFFIFIV